jgi:hypothetical protein
MPESESTSSAPATEQSTPCESPPPAPNPPRDEIPDPRVRLLQLAAELMRSQNRRLVVEYLRLRRAI